MTIAFWLLAVSPGLLHPGLLFIYFQRFSGRKRYLLDVINRPRSGEGRLASTRQQMDTWRNQLDLNLAAYLLPVIICSLLSVAGGIALVSAHDPANQLHLGTRLKDLLRFAQPAIIAGFAGASCPKRRTS
jgi:hypothetical protein